MLERVRKKGDPCTLLVEIKLVQLLWKIVPPKTKNTVII